MLNSGFFIRILVLDKHRFYKITQISDQQDRGVKDDKNEVLLEPMAF